MDKKKKKKGKYNMSDFTSVALSTELTGLVQTPPESIDEAESYKDLADIPTQKGKSLK